MATLEELAKRAAAGDRSALDEVVTAVRDDVYHLARRMLGDADDAADATQEILIKVVTHLGNFRGESALRTWVYRVAANTLVSMKRGRREIFSFDMMEGFIAGGVASGLPPPPSADVNVLAEEVMVGCTQGALLSLDRDQRIAFTLCELLDFDGDEAAAILEIEPATLRKRLSRARERLREFMQKNCGLVNEANACRCPKMVGPSVAQGLLDPERLRFSAAKNRTERGDPVIGELLGQLADLDARVREVLRAHPRDRLDDATAGRVREIIGSRDFKMFQG